MSEQPLPIVPPNSDAARELLAEIKREIAAGLSEVMALTPLVMNPAHFALIDELGALLMQMRGRDLAFIVANFNNTAGMVALSNLYRELHFHIMPSLPEIRRTITEGVTSTQSMNAELDDVERQLTQLGVIEEDQEGEERLLTYSHELNRLEGIMQAAGYFEQETPPPTWVKRQWNEIAYMHNTHYPFHDAATFQRAIALIHHLIEDLTTLPQYSPPHSGPNGTPPPDYVPVELGQSPSRIRRLSLPSSRTHDATPSPRK